jgi:DNA-directed RNA polymerase specialized sigma24 family protein
MDTRSPTRETPQGLPSRASTTIDTESLKATDRQPSRRTAARLNREWDDMCGHPALWLSPSPSLEMVLQSVRFNPDKVLLGLIAACQEGYSVAGRVIVQALLPKLILFSAAHPHPELDHLLAALWLRIDRYPVARRRSSVAANLLMDTRKDVLTEGRSPRPVLLGFDETQAATIVELGVTRAQADDGLDEEDLDGRSILSMARRLGLASSESLLIVEEVYLAGLPSEQVARRHHISPAAVRRRCSDTVQRLRSHREALAEAA